MNKEIFDGDLLFLVDTQPDTCEVDRSEIRTQILLATASSALKGRRSFTHMLTEVRRQGGRLVSPPPGNYWWLCFHDDRVHLAGLGQTLPYLGNKLAGYFQPCLLVDSHSVLTRVKTSVLIRVLLFREKQADAEAPVFPMESAAVSAHSECLPQQSEGSCLKQLVFTWYLLFLPSFQFSAKLRVSLRQIPAEGFLWRVQWGRQPLSVCFSRSVVRSLQGVTESVRFPFKFWKSATLLLL